jgi:hypothetical protein
MPTEGMARPLCVTYSSGTSALTRLSCSRWALGYFLAGAAISALPLSGWSRARISSQIGSQPPDGGSRVSTILPICRKFRRVTDRGRTRDLL